jgi:hypothetical protein
VVRVVRAAQGDLRHIKELKFWGPADVLMSKYSMDEHTARMVESFMLPCLNTDPRTWLPCLCGASLPRRPCRFLVVRVA